MNDNLIFSPEEQALIDSAKSVLGKIDLGEDLTAGTVAAALRTDKGNVYTGICIDLSCGLGFCAEVAAMAEMLKHRETQVVSIVAVGGSGIMSPCGRCRETLAQINPQNFSCKILLPEGLTASLRELLPEHWL